MATLAAALLFVAAGDLQYWDGWLLLAAYFIPLVILTRWLIRNAPQLLAHRLEAGIGASEARHCPEYAPDYWATFFTDPDGLRLEITNFRQTSLNLACPVMLRIC